MRVLLTAVQECREIVHPRQVKQAKHGVRADLRRAGVHVGQEGLESLHGNATVCDFDLEDVSKEETAQGKRTTSACVNIRTSLDCASFIPPNNIA